MSKRRNKNKSEQHPTYWMDPDDPEIRWLCGQIIGLVLLELRKKGYSREERKRMVRDSGLIETSHDGNRIWTMLHATLESEVDDMINLGWIPENEEERQYYDSYGGYSSKEHNLIAAGLRQGIPYDEYLV